MTIDTFLRKVNGTRVSFDDIAVYIRRNVEDGELRDAAVKYLTAEQELIDILEKIGFDL